MPTKEIFIVLGIIILVVIIYAIFSSTTATLSHLKDATQSQVISAKKLPRNNDTSNYTYSLWFFVNEWNYKVGEPKTILSRVDNHKNPCPSMTLGEYQNDLTIAVTCYKNKASDPDGGKSKKDYTVFPCTIDNVPLQRWVNLLISLNGRTLDVYLDGKLVRTCVLPGVAKVAAASDVVLSPNGGFNGWTSKVQYWANSTNPQEAWNIYKSGYGGSALGNLLNKYRIKIAFLEDNIEQSSFEL
jgi:hypothetical protein